MARNFNISDLYTPLSQQAKFHASPAKFRLLGGAAGGGKTIAVIWEAILRSIKYDFPITGAIFRKSYPELEATIIRTMRELLPDWSYQYHSQRHTMTIFNGSIIEFCYAESDDDVYRYQSREWDWLGIDELTHFTEFQWTYLLSRVRTTKPINTKFFAATNPGNVGHEWVKKRWVTKNCDNENYRQKDYDFIPAGVYENPYIMEANPDYIENLQMLPEKERKALLEGNWDVFEGQFFNEWSPTRHIVDDFDVPEDWQLVMGWDDGTRDPRSVHLYALDSDQKVWCIWEYYKTNENLRTAAENIRRELKEKGFWGRIYKCVVDPSMKRIDSQTGMSSVEILEGMGFGFQIGEIELGNNKRVEGWRVMKSYLSFKPYEEPLLKFFRSCTNITRTIPQLIYYQSRSGRASKKEDLDTTQEDHCLTGDTLISLPTKYVPIRNLVGTSGNIITLGGIRKYHKVRKTGHKKVWKITFSDGTSLKATPEHPILNNKFEWQSIKDFSIGDKILDFRATDLIQLDTNEPKDNKQNDSRVWWRKILQVSDLLSERWNKIAQNCLGKLLWEDSEWLSYTSQGWEFGKQLDRKSGIVKPVPTSFLSLKAFKARDKGEVEEALRQSKAISEKMACFKRGERMAQSSWKGNLGEKKRDRKDLSILWKDLQDQVSWYFKVLSSKLQSKSKTKKITKIQELGYRDVYNLQINDVHCFMIDGGTIVHNSADDCRYTLMSFNILPTRFNSSTVVDVKRRSYVPNSSFR